MPGYDQTRVNIVLVCYNRIAIINQGGIMSRPLPSKAQFDAVRAQIDIIKRGEISVGDGQYYRGMKLYDILEDTEVTVTRLIYTESMLSPEDRQVWPRSQWNSPFLVEVEFPNGEKMVSPLGLLQIV